MIRPSSTECISWWHLKILYSLGKTGTLAGSPCSNTKFKVLNWLKKTVQATISNSRSTQRQQWNNPMNWIFKSSFHSWSFCCWCIHPSLAVAKIPPHFWWHKNDFWRLPREVATSRCQSSPLNDRVYKSHPAGFAVLEKEAFTMNQERRVDKKGVIRKPSFSKKNWMRNVQIGTAILTMLLPILVRSSWCRCLFHSRCGGSLHFNWFLVLLTSGASCGKLMYLPAEKPSKGTVARNTLLFLTLTASCWTTRCKIEQMLIQKSMKRYQLRRSSYQGACLRFKHWFDTLFSLQALTIAR